jgi:arylsulfatase A-like enzyme
VSEPASTLDLFPTLVTLTGADPPPLRFDGQDISKLLTGEADKIGGRGVDGGREIVFWQQSGPGGLRSGKWKYLRPGLWSSSPTLFDLEADPGEKSDLSQARPEMVRQLEDRLQEILAGG